MKSQENKKKVFVGLSGGVDSSVSAALLIEQGYDVTGVFIRVWQPDWIVCTWKEDRLDAMRVCAKLGIPFKELNLEKEYKKEVADYMIEEYKKGNTPNPDVMCNQHIKFGGFYDWAMKQGAEFVATGHYARNVQVKSLKLKVKKENREPKSKTKNLQQTTYNLLAGSDPQKDQSYFLWKIRKDQLAHILFPVGGMLKPEVRKMAKKFGLVTAGKKDSQGLCFIGKIDMKDFLKRYIKEKPGKVLNEAGKVIGTHEGAVFYTLGERHGFTLNAEQTQNKRGTNAENLKPYYVVAKNMPKNTLVVSHDSKKEIDAISKTNFPITDINWTVDDVLSRKNLSARLRYRQPLQVIRIKNVEKGVDEQKIEVVFDVAQSGGAPGQSIVIYDGEVCLGGGIIA